MQMRQKGMKVAVAAMTATAGPAATVMLMMIAAVVAMLRSRNMHDVLG